MHLLGSEYAKNAFAALEKLTALPETPNCIWWRRFAAKREMGAQEWKGKGRKKRERKAGQRRGRAPKTAYSVIPVAFFTPVRP